MGSQPRSVVSCHVLGHSVDQFAGTGNQRAWLYALATSVFLNDLQVHGRERPIDEERTREFPGAPIEAFVGILPRTQRVALVQRKFHNRSYAEIATSLGCSETAARVFVYTALGTLRDHLEDRP